jgi:hypothetical protein
MCTRVQFDLGAMSSCHWQQVSLEVDILQFQKFAAAARWCYTEKLVWESQCRLP